MSKVERLIRATLRAHKIKHGYAGGGVADDEAAMMPETYANPLVKAVIGGVGEQIATPGQIMKSNPYPSGSEEASWYDDQRANAGESWAQNMALNTIGGAGVVPAEANSLRSGIKAYHGSPHDFDRFDLSKVGTGEGAQTYGHGLYFAENPAVAGAYRNLAPSPGPLPADVRVAMNQLDNLGFDSAGQAMSVARSDPNWMKKWDVDPTRSPREAEAATKVQKYIEENPRGHGYEVNINADPAHFLDWDKPNSQQHPLVREALNRLGLIKEEALAPTVDNPAIIKQLSDMGVPGAKYLDQGSRAAGDGSRNYVVFNDKLIDILKKYGIAAAAAPGLAEEIMRNGEQHFASGGAVGMAEGGKPPFDPSQPFEPVAPAAGAKPPFDPSQPFEPVASPGVGAQVADAAGETAKGVPRGFGNFLGTMGEAVMGPFGRDAQSREAMANAPEPTPADIEKYGSRYGYFQSKMKPSYGQDIAHAAHIEANPQTTAGKYAAPISEVLGNPASWLGPGGALVKGTAAIASGAGGEAAREAAEGSGFEGLAELGGSLVGGYLPGKVASVGHNIVRGRNVQTTEQLHQAATNDYESARNLGVEYQPRRVSQLQANIEADLIRQGHRDDKASGTFRRIDELTNFPQRKAGLPDFSDIESVRKTLNEVRQEVHQNTGRPTEDARAAGIAIHHIDDFLADPTNALPIHQGQSLQNTGIAITGNPNSPAAQAARFAESGRANWSAMVSSQEIERALSRGELGAASAGSGANIDNTLRQQIKNILNNPRRLRGFSNDEQQMMRDIVMGNPVRNSARLIGKMAATGIVSAAGVEFLSHQMGLGMAGHLLLPTAGYAAKKTGDYMTRARINRLLEAVQMDSPAGRANPVGPRAAGAPFALRSALSSPYGAALGNPYTQ